MWLKVAAIAALCVTDAFAQPPGGIPQIRNQGCMTAGRGMLPFQFCVEVPMVTPPTTLFWNASVNDAIEFAFEGTAEAWRAVGFSDVAMMGPSNVVVGCVPAIATPMQADFSLPAPPARMPTGGLNNQQLQAYESTVADNLCTVTFRRPVNITRDAMQPLDLQLLNDRMQMVIAARGPGTDFPAQHMGTGANRIIFGVNFANPNVGPDAPGEMTTSMMPGDTDAPAGDNGASTLGASMALIPAIVGSVYAALW